MTVTSIKQEIFSGFVLSLPDPKAPNWLELPVVLQRGSQSDGLIQIPLREIAVIEYRGVTRKPSVWTGVLIGAMSGSYLGRALSRSSYSDYRGLSEAFGTIGGLLGGALLGAVVAGTVRHNNQDTVTLTFHQADYAGKKTYLRMMRRAFR